KELTFSYLFSSASSTADVVIEGLLSSEADPSSVTVVTRDRAILHSALEAGALVMDPEDMLKWSDQSAAQEKNRAADTRPSGSDQFGIDLNGLL
ncbi:MAG: NYN domain-containing protein, partial [Opitutales bacterium]